MKRLKILFCALFFISCATHEIVRSIASVESELGRPVEILVNDGTTLKLKIGEGISDIKKFLYRIEVDDRDVATGEIEVGTTNDVIEVQIPESGLYTLSLRIPWWPQRSWEQDIRVVKDEDLKYDSQKHAELAKLYAPIASYHKDEKYFPVTLDYILNREDKNSLLDEEVFRFNISRGIINKLYRERVDFSFKFKDLGTVLRYWGNRYGVIKLEKPEKGGLKVVESQLLKRKGDFNHSTIYYSVFESQKTNKLYVNYHFLYPFDPKLGTDEKADFASHTFDRESLTVILDRDSLNPLGVVYGAHLELQKIGYFEDNKVVDSWRGGRVYVAWDDVTKHDTHPIAYLAKGSHGVFPKKGTYGVYRLEFTIGLKEEAGGTQLLIPPALLNLKKESGTAYAEYSLKDLQVDHLTSHGWNGPLSFSGHFVDVKGRITNASFPPFTKRERNIERYTDPERVHHFKP